MQFRKLALAATSALLCSASLSHAVLTGFTDFGYTGGNTASWDFFYSANYLQTFSYTTGTTGNPTNAADNFTLVANVPNWQPGSPAATHGQATGPIDSNGSTVGGNQDLFYTSFGNPVNFSINGIVTGTELDTFSLQAAVWAGSAGGLTNVLLNGVAATVSGVNGSSVNYWTWSNLDLTAGSSFTLTFQAATQHSVFDAFQIQTDAQVVPEPSTYAFLALGFGLVLFRFRKRLVQA